MNIYGLFTIRPNFAPNSLVPPLFVDLRQLPNLLLSNPDLVLCLLLFSILYSVCDSRVVRVLYYSSATL